MTSGAICFRLLLGAPVMLCQIIIEKSDIKMPKKLFSSTATGQVLTFFLGLNLCYAECYIFANVASLSHFTKILFICIL